MRLPDEPPVSPSVLSSPENAVRPFLSRPLLIFVVLSIAMALFLFPLSCFAAGNASLDDAIRQLADRVAAITNLRGPLRLQFFEDSNFEAETGKDWQVTFRKEIENHHLVLTDDPAATPLHIGFAETPTQLVLSAVTRVSEKEEVRLLSLPRTAFRAASLPVAPIRIERQLVYQSADRILDASSLGNGAEGGMALLAGPNATPAVLRIDSSGQLAQTISLPSTPGPVTRDPRGELSVHANEVAVLLSAKSCEFTWAASSDAKCHTATPTWRAPIVLTPTCGTGGWKLLADGPDWVTPGVLQVVPDAALRQGSAALLSDFPGPILSINGGQNPASALVVTRNLRTGNYEVHKITLACGN
jgi:hypothetical protein